MERWLNKIWYGPRGIAFFMLWPLSLLFRTLSGIRRFCYRASIFSSHRLTAPVVIIGNLTVGGTGKTPLVLWLIDALRALDKKPGVISRGYGGRGGSGPLTVEPDMRAVDCGDEPLMIRRRAGCPVVVGSNRVQAGQKLIEMGCDVVVSDDGLQHLRLRRDLELIVIDGSRGLGNRGLIPAGPLREPPGRLSFADAVIVNGEGWDHDGAMRMTLTGQKFCRLDGQVEASAEDFDGTVHAVAGIGNPQRFFAALRSMGLEIIPHAFPDHYSFEAGALDFADGRATIMTEKDAARVNGDEVDNIWYLPVTAKFTLDEAARLRAIVARVFEPEPIRSM